MMAAATNISVAVREHTGGTAGLTHVWKSARWQTHRCTGHQNTAHDQQIWMWICHASSNLLHKWQDNERGDSVADECSDNCDECCKYHQHSVQAQMLYTSCDGHCNGVQQPGRVDSFAKSQTTSSEDDDGPEKVVEVFLGQDSRTKEQGNWNDGNDTHVTKDGLQLVAHTPQHDRRKSDNANEPLDPAELVLHRPDGNNGSVAAWFEGDEKEKPDKQDRCDAHWESDEEPNAPAGLR